MGLSISLANNDVSFAKEYHEETKHSEISIRYSHHVMDWGDKPNPFKVYRSLPQVLLPSDVFRPKSGAFKALTKLKFEKNRKPIDVATLAGILFFSGGLTRESKLPFGTYHMRAAPATGALYPIEIYVVNGDIDGLKAGVYHFGPADFALTRLRDGDYRAELSSATGNQESLTSSPVILVLTSLAWRNAWKYQSRSYRHWFWDSGVLTSNLLATAASAKLDAQLVMGFSDRSVDKLLCLEEGKEASIVLISLGRDSNIMASQSTQDVSEFKPEMLSLSRNEMTYDAIWKMHEASSLYEAEDVRSWTQGTREIPLPKETVSNDIVTYPLIVERGGDSLQEPTLEEVILRRGSTRRFSSSPISFGQLSEIIINSTTPLPMDFLDEKNTTNVHIYFIANAVEGLPSGAYYFNRERMRLAQIKQGELRKISGYLCLDQPLFSVASVVFFLMTDLNVMLNRYGNRGYRASQFEAGVVAGNIYLSAYAVGIGASGSTFYDDSVTEFFSPHAAEKSTMIAVGIGNPDYRARPGEILLGRMSRAELLGTEK